MSGGDEIVVAGQTCWRIEQANRVRPIVDAADYFRTAKAAMLGARHQIMLIGWDFDSRIELERGDPTVPGPNRLGDFLAWLVQRTPGLDVYLLKWNIGMLYGLQRGMVPISITNWLTEQRLHLMADSRHPVGSAQHEKIVVIDDAFAFCGGIDMTAQRWDTREHPAHDARRRDPGEHEHGPWHDVTTAVEGPVARALGELARERWVSAGGSPVEPTQGEVGEIWPDFLVPTFTDVRVAIARSRPEYGDCTEVREVEACYLRLIRCARSLIYIETQYLASRVIVEAIIERLADPDCPEIVLVLPRNAGGWLEQKAMDGARQRLLRLLWHADAHQRFRVYYPVAEDGSPIYVHAKVFVMDDRVLRIGSSNLNNRSMGFDSECDLVIDRELQGHDVAPEIRQLRKDLVAEHLGCRVEEIGDCSLIEVIERLRGETGRTLMPFDREEIAEEESIFADSELLDPEGRAEAGPTWAKKLRRKAKGRLAGGADR
ncbi:phospholipase D-like domain-containing protein [Nocardia sp. NPDC058518]|uniref:phospholipase D-like domain-containing protein n=1 Tax=Nocardia sp. NPDC058518 TaxID=3346534 RepID=UPI003656DF5D